MIDHIERPQFADRPELKPVTDTLEKLSTKSGELQKAANKKPNDSTDARKNAILQRLLASITEKIRDYDNNPVVTQSKNEELLKLKQVLFEMMLDVIRLTPNEIKVIGTTRNNHKKNTSFFLRYGSIGAGAASGVAFGSPLLLGIGGGVAGNILGGFTNKQTGMSDPRPQSMIIIYNLMESILNVTEQIATNLKELRIASFQKTLWITDTLDMKFILPLTVYLSDNPASLELIYKDNSGKVMQLPLGDMLKDNAIKTIRSNKQLYLHHMVEILAHLNRQACLQFENKEEDKQEDSLPETARP